jgi:hypothetical protein
MCSLRSVLTSNGLLPKLDDPQARPPGEVIASTKNYGLLLFARCAVFQRAQGGLRKLIAPGRQLRCVIAVDMVRLRFGASTEEFSRTLGF